MRGRRASRFKIGAGRAEVLLTPALVVLVVLLGLIAGLRPAVASPTVTALLWAGLVSLVVVGVVWPLTDRRSQRVVVARCPTDTLEGVAFPVELSMDRGGLPLRVDLDESVGLLGPANGAPGTVLVNARPVGAQAAVTRRGVYETLLLRVTDSGPFGLLKVTRRVRASLAAPLYVGPRSIEGDPRIDRDGSGNEPSSEARVVMAGDTVRTVRPYVAGDPAHLVHWPTSAHAGELMVMELEPPAERLLVVVVDLRSGRPGQAESVEDAVRLAAGAVQRGLDESMRVILCTAQMDGPLSAEVSGTRQMRRRLAAAVPGTPGPVPEDCVPVIFTPSTSRTPADGVARGQHMGTQER